MEATPQILVVSSELESRRALNAVLLKEGYETICAAGLRESQEALQSQNISLIFCDRHLKDGNYQDVIAATNGCHHPARGFQ